MRGDERRRRFAAAGVTVLFHAAVVGALIMGVLRYDAAEEATREWPPVDSSEILFGGEYVVRGDVDAVQTEPEVAEAPAAPAAEAAPAETETAPAAEKMLTAKAETGVKARDDAKAREDAEAKARKKQRDEAAAEARRKQEAAEREAAARIGDRVKFGGERKGTPDANSETGAVSGVSTSGLGNRKPENLAHPSRGPLGRIVVSIKVDRSGRVTSAKFLSGTGAAAASESSRRSCEAAARSSKFTADENAPAVQNGTLTYVFK